MSINPAAWPIGSMSLYKAKSADAFIPEFIFAIPT
jgi:hypothetical protein